MGSCPQLPIAYNQQAFQKPPARSIRDALLRFARNVTVDKLYKKGVLSGEVVNVLSWKSNGCSFIVSRIQCSKWNQLSPRERQVAVLVGNGSSNKAIAKRLGISPATVAVYLRRTYSKLSISSRITLAQFSTLETVTSWPLLTQ
jgi:DNA-binding NarL/FixJ family response regulator